MHVLIHPSIHVEGILSRNNVYHTKAFSRKLIKPIFKQSPWPWPSCEFYFFSYKHTQHGCQDDNVFAWLYCGNAIRIILTHLFHAPCYVGTAPCMPSLLVSPCSGVFQSLCHNCVGSNVCKQIWHHSIKAHCLQIVERHNVWWPFFLFLSYAVLKLTKQRVLKYSWLAQQFQLS